MQHQAIHAGYFFRMIRSQVRQTPSADRDQPNFRDFCLPFKRNLPETPFLKKDTHHRESLDVGRCVAFGLFWPHV